MVGIFVGDSPDIIRCHGLALPAGLEQLHPILRAQCLMICGMVVSIVVMRYLKIPPATIPRKAVATFIIRESRR